MTEPDQHEGRLTPEAAFSLLGNPTRLAILRTLWEAEDPIQFSELRRGVAVDDSGQFNYHLSQLVDHYVTSVEGGYQLTSAGEYVIGAILANLIDPRPQLGAFPIEGTCTTCGGGLEATFGDLGEIRCVNCDKVVMGDAFPPAGGHGRTPDEISRAFDDWLRQRARLAWRGVCPRCAGRVSRRYVVPEDGTGVRMEYECEHCRHEGRGPLVGELVYHPAVVAAFYDDGIDVMDVPYWELRHVLDTFEEEVLETEPLLVRVQIPFDDGRLELTVDDAGEVVAVVEN